MGSIVSSLFVARVGAPPLALAAAFALSWAGAAAIGADPAMAAVVDDHRDCGGGAESPLDVVVTPVRSVAAAGGDALVFDVAIGNRLAGAAAARYGLELVSDTGAPVTAPVRSPKIALAKAGHHHAELTAPAGLADGYYVARVTAAAADGTAAATQVVEVYLRADAGSVHQVDSDEYFARSRASVGGEVMRSLVLAIGMLAAAATTASASSGYVRARVQFFQNQGGYCPSSRDCTGARYLESQFHTYQPIGDTRVWIRRDSDGTVIGQGSTDADGYFTIRWSDPSSSGSVAATFAWQAEHKDGRFAVRNADGQAFRMSSSPFLLASGTTAGAPTELGNRRWGTSSSPHAIANVYDGATRMWNVLKTSNRMLTYFTDVEIRAFSSAQCGTSCASGKLVILDDNAAYAPQARVMHELGHVASTLSNKGQTRSLPPDIYCFLDTANCGWSLNSQEWQAAAFEEGLATFYGDVALYTAAGAAPHTCYASAAPCATGTFNAEASSRSACATGENRWALSTIRYLRDAYDDNADYPGETLSAPYHEFFDTVHSFDEGTWEDQKEEYWNADRSALDDKDGRSAHDFRDVWIPWGTDSTAQYQGNCSPVGTDMSQPTRVHSRPSRLVFLAAMVAVIALGVTLGRRQPAAPTRAAAPATVEMRGSAPAAPTLPTVVADSQPSRRAADEWQGMPIDPEATALCDAVDACGLAMACIGGRCGACTGDDSCAAGEICALDHCVRAELVSCRSRADCGADALCILSGTSADPRGNAAMTARCLLAAGGTADDTPAVVAGEPASRVPVPAAELLDQVERDQRDR